MNTSGFSNITDYNAVLSGNLVSLGSATKVSVSFEYGPTTSYGSSTTAEVMTSAGTFSTKIIGLTRGKIYHFRARADGGEQGISFGSDTSFTTTTTSPVVTSAIATDISGDSAQVTGNLIALGNAASVSISLEYGTTSDYGSSTTAQTMSATGIFNARLANLSPETTYHFRIMADGGAQGIAYSPDATFATTKLIIKTATVSSLNIQPIEADASETININVQASNAGTTGVFRVILKINGVEEANQEIAIASGANQEVVFNTSRSIAGTYQVDVNGIISSFKIKSEPPPIQTPEPQPGFWKSGVQLWLTIGGVLALAIGLAIFLIAKWRNQS